MKHLALTFFFTLAAAAQNLWPGKEWARTTPVEAGLDAKVLKSLDSAFTAGTYGTIDGFLLIRHGKLAYERSYKHNYDSIYAKEAVTQGPLNAHDPGGQYNYFNPWWHPFYRRGNLHSLQSVTKTITSAIIGVAITRGDFPSIETPILKFFDTTKVANIDARKRRITIRHLLTMTAGFDWKENLPYSDPSNDAVIMEASLDWVQYTVDRPMAAEPGTVFNYNSGASEILSYVFRSATRSDIEEYAVKYLFKPLGITDHFWKRTPTGLADTEGGLYLAIEDVARIFYLYLCKGVWGGKQIIGEDWIKASTTPFISVPGAPVKYGYKWWLFPYDKDTTRLAWMGSGFGGQRPIVLPEYGIVAVVTAWNVETGKPGLGAAAAVNRILDSIVERRGGSNKK